MPNQRYTVTRPSCFPLNSTPLTQQTVALRNLLVLQIANYPFTTLQPQLGILEVDQKQIVLADIPGLIPGASQNRGRGFAFLRHVERTRMLAYVLDLSSGAGFSNGRSHLQQLSDLQVVHHCSQSQLTLHADGSSITSSLLLRWWLFAG